MIRWLRRLLCRDVLLLCEKLEEENSRLAEECKRALSLVRALRDVNADLDKKLNSLGD